MLRPTRRKLERFEVEWAFLSRQLSEAERNDPSFDQAPLMLAWVGKDLTEREADQAWQTMLREVSCRQYLNDEAPSAAEWDETRAIRGHIDNEGWHDELGYARRRGYMVEPEPQEWERD